LLSHVFSESIAPSTRRKAIYIATYPSMMADNTMPYLDPHNMALLQTLGTVSNGKSFSEFTISQQRGLFQEIQKPRPANPGITVSEHVVHTIHGEVKTFLYMPKTMNSAIPFVYYVHGGGWIFGGAAEFEAFAFDLVTKTGIAVVFPEYTLAPEKQFPVQHEQCLEVLQHVIKVGGEHGLETDRVVLAGDSSGGMYVSLPGNSLVTNAAAGQIISAISTLNKQRSLNLPIAHQIMLHPYINVTSEILGGMLRDPVWAEQQKAAYFPTLEDRSSILGAPSRMSEEEVKKYMPPTTLIVADQDPFKDQNEAFAKLLQTAGVSCGVVQAFGSFHDVEIFHQARDSPTVELVMFAIAGKLREVMGC